MSAKKKVGSLGTYIMFLNVASLQSRVHIRYLRISLKIFTVEEQLRQT